MKITAEPRSDQWNADDFTGGPRTFTIAKVVPGKAEQKYDIELVEGEGRVWRPPLTMLRVLIALWSDDASKWVGQRVTLFNDPTIRFGPNVVGGIRISHMSGITKPQTIAITATRGKRAPFVVQPLGDAPVAPQQASTGDDITRALNAIDTASDASKLDAIEKHAASLGIDQTPEIQSALITKRGELEGLL